MRCFSAHSGQRVCPGMAGCWQSPHRPCSLSLLRFSTARARPRSCRCSTVRRTRFGFSDTFGFAAVVAGFEALRAGVRAAFGLAGFLASDLGAAHCLTSNVTELRSNKVSWRIQSRNWRNPGQRRRKDSPQRVGGHDSGIHPSGIPRLINTRRASPNSHYIKRPPRSAPQPWSDILQALNTLGFGAHPRGVRLPRRWWPFGAFPPTSIDLIQSTRASE